MAHSTRAPRTSPVTPPKRRTQRRRRSNEDATPTTTAAAQRTASDQPRSSSRRLTAAATATADAVSQGVNRRSRSGPHRGPESVAPGRAHSAAAAPCHRDPTGGDGHDEAQPTGASAHRLRDRRHLDEEYEDERGDTERTGINVGPPHHLERVRGRSGRAETVGRVRQPVEMHAARQDGERRDGEDRGEQLAGYGVVGRLPGALEHSAARGAEEQPQRRPPEHRLAGNRAVDRGGRAYTQDRERTEREPDPVRTTHASPSRSDTPASSNVAIRASVAPAARRTGRASRAPVPSPSRRP